MLSLGNKIIAGSFKTGASWEVGDVGISAFGIDEALNKRRYLNGQVISQTQFVQFTAFLKSRISVYPSLATTEVNWQAAVTNSDLGQCGKFVIDDNAGTIRLPKVVNINGLSDLALMGSIKNESLPNITGTIGTYTGNVGGAFYLTSSGSSNNLNTSGGTRVGLDASRSSPTYQDNAPVQQEAVQYPYFIQVAEGVETSVDVSREIELNNPFSLLDYKYSEYELSNASWLLSNGQWNSGAVYQSVYDLLLQELNGTSNRLPYIEQVNKIGNLTDNNGILSGFSASNYAKTNIALNFSSADTWEIVTKQNISSVSSINDGYMGVLGGAFNVNYYINTANKITVELSSNGTSYNIGSIVMLSAVPLNTDFYLKTEFTGIAYNLYYSTDGETWTLQGSISSSTKVSNRTNNFAFGVDEAGNHTSWIGSVDLKGCYININGERRWTGRRKIVTTVGNYADIDFVLNTSDATFRLPLKVALASGKAVAGNGKGLGLTNGTVEGYLDSWRPGSGVSGTLSLSTNNTLGSNSSMGYATGSTSTFGVNTDPTKSGIETSANGLYLYFYVGETIQDANIIAAAGVLTDVADLKNASNFSSLGKETVVGWGMPDFTAGISKAWATAHLADKDYFVAVSGFGSSSMDCYALQVSQDGVNWTTIASYYSGSGGNGKASNFIPKGMYYRGASGTSNQSLTVYPLKGEN